MTSVFKEPLVGAVNATKLMNHRTPAAMALLKEHHDGECQHDVRRIMDTFGKQARTVVNGRVFEGIDPIEQFHEALGFGDRGSFTNLNFDIFKYHQSDDAITVEFSLKGTHTGDFGGVTATGKPIDVPVTAIYSFDTDGKLVRENIYFDATIIMRQIGALLS
jgi:predicted ester cyclase